MDVLSDVLVAMRTGRPHAAETQTHAPWGVRFQGGEGAGCHVLLRGSCWLIPANGDPLRLGVGDVVFVSRAGYGLADHPDSHLVDFAPGNDDESAPLDQVRIAGPGPVTTMLCAAYYFDRARQHPILDELPEVVHVPAHIGQHPSLRATIDLLGNELAAPRAGTGAVLPPLVDLLLLFVLRAWFEEQAGKRAGGWAIALDDTVVGTALQAIHRRPEHAWTVQALASLGGVSRAAFAKRFGDLTGQPPLTYLTWWRMTVAAQALRDTDASLRNIAGRAGYTSEFAFAKAFKRAYGRSPGGYRRQHRSVQPVR